MFLAVDVGNTKIALGLFALPKKTTSTSLKESRTGRSSNRTPPPKLLASWRLTTTLERTADEYRVLIRQLLSEHGISLERIQQVAIGSVVPAVTPTLLHSFHKSTIVNELNSQSNFSFKNLAIPSTQVGIDRLLNAEAAIRQWQAPCILVDSGTATTLCAIRKSKSSFEYLGGAIMPGIELSISALAKRAAKLFSVELMAPKKAIGTNTRDAMQSGIILGYAEMIDGMIRRFTSELPRTPKPRVIATGGVSEFLSGLTREIEIHDPELTLKGIFYVNYATYS